MYPTDCHSEEGKFGNNIVCTHRNKCAPRLKGEAILTLCWFPEQYVWQRLKILLVVKWFKLCRNQLTDVEQTLSDSCSWWIFHPQSSHRLFFFITGVEATRIWLYNLISSSRLQDNLKCVLTPQHTFPLSVSPSQMRSGPEKSKSFLDVGTFCWFAQIWLRSYFSFPIYMLLPGLSRPHGVVFWSVLSA